ncbi:MAG: DUF2029 domain-containing protein [Deltaproteobacteria bacterium]|nr:DUF2029 domain-containing protein [Deltaproteobacteria bacterium]
MLFRLQFRFNRHDIVRILAIIWLIGVVVFFSIFYLNDLNSNRLERRDYYCFYYAGLLYRQGQSGYEHPERLFANPPFVLPLLALISKAGPTRSYLIFFALGVLCVIASIRVATRIQGVPKSFFLTWLLLAFSTPSLFFALHLGQLTPVYLLLWSLTLWGWCTGSDRIAGIASACLSAKPPLALFAWIFGFLIRPWRFRISAIIGLFALVLIGKPWQIENWEAFFKALEKIANKHEHKIESWRKQHTLYAILRTLLWKAHGSPIQEPEQGLFEARVLALAIILALSIVGGFFFFRHRKIFLEWRHRPERMARLCSLAMLATVSLNFYLFYYDSAILILSAMILFAFRSDWISLGRWWGALLCAIGIALSQPWVVIFLNFPSPVGALALTWLVLEAQDLAALLHKEALMATSQD